MLLLARVSSQSLDVGGVHFTTSWYIIFFFFLGKRSISEGRLPYTRVRASHKPQKELTLDLINRPLRRTTSRINQVAFLVNVDTTWRPWLIQGARKGADRHENCAGQSNDTRFVSWQRGPKAPNPHNVLHSRPQARLRGQQQCGGHEAHVRYEDGFKVLLTSRLSWQAANAKVASHGKPPRPRHAAKGKAAPISNQPRPR